MRILTWNVNGLKPFMNYDPFYACKGAYDQAFDLLEADVVCFQELKTPRSQLLKSQACPPGFDAFLSLPASGKGYSGVGTFTRQSSVVPSRAEEGLLGGLETRGVVGGGRKEEEGRIGGYPRWSDVVPDADDFPASDLSSSTAALDPTTLDAEGRTTILDLSLFVLINVYCPATSPNPAREPFKLAFLRALGRRVEGLRKEGREVMVVGDLNVVARVEDHGEGSLASKQEGFWKHPARQWFDRLLAPKGPLHDVVREAHPAREGMFTCWETRIDARASNYGTRLDYILVTPGLLPWVKHADIQPSIRGSDHCPVFVDLHESLPASALHPGPSSGVRPSVVSTAASSGADDDERVYLKDLLNNTSSPDPRQRKLALPPDPTTGTRRASRPPASCAANWEEFGERSLMGWVVAGGGGGLKDKGKGKSSVGKGLAQEQEKREGGEVVDLTASSPEPEPSPSSTASAWPSAPPLPPATLSSSSASAPARKQPKTSSSSAAAPPAKSGQMTLSAFFAPPPPPPTKGKGKVTAKRASSSSAAPDSAPANKRVKREATAPAVGSSSTGAPEDNDSADLAFAHSLAADDDDVHLEGPSSSVSASAAKEVWEKLLKPPPVPRCTVHGVECIERTVTKPGPNKGKAFYLCSLPLGPGHDSNARSTGRLRAEVDRRFKCDFFAWRADVKSQAADARWLAGGGGPGGRIRGG